MLARLDGVAVWCPPPSKRHRTIDANYNHCDPNKTLTSHPTHRTKAYYY